MKTKMALIGVLGFSAVATASPNVQFLTVIDQNDSLAGGNFLGAGQVVAGPDGTVAISALLDNGNPVVIYSTPASATTWTNNPIAVAGNSYNIAGIGSSETFDYFDNVAVTGNPASGTRVIFTAEDPNSNSGIIQWDTNSPALADVAFDGDTNGYNTVGGTGTFSGGSLLEEQVNGSGQALFPAVDNSSSQSVLIRGDASGLTPIFTSSVSLSNSSQTGNRVALGADNSAAAVLDSTTGTAIYSIPANAGTPTKISGSFIPSNAADPLVGYASGNGINVALMLVNGTGAGTTNVVLEKNGGAPQPLLSDFTIPASDVFQGQMAPNGQIAMYIPSTTGDTIQYANAASGSPSASVVASVAPLVGPAPSSAIALDPSGTNLKIEGLTELGANWGPEINSGGTIIFTADVGTSALDEKTALLEWTPGTTSPEILFADGDTITVAGQPVTLDDFTLNSLSNEYDYYKNALNDQNGLAVAVDYTDALGNPGSAVLYTEVPEPTTLALLSVASVGLMARRRRH